MSLWGTPADSDPVAALAVSEKAAMKIGNARKDRNEHIMPPSSLEDSAGEHPTDSNCSPSYHTFALKIPSLNRFGWIRTLTAWYFTFSLNVHNVSMPHGHKMIDT